MKVVILAGGLGTRLSEETQVKPKPMAEIGEHPILWHIMKIYGEQGFTDFVVCLGYKGYVIKEYFANYFLHNSDVTFDLQGQCMEVHENTVEPWRVTLVDTGAETQTGGRLKRVAPYVADETLHDDLRRRRRRRRPRRPAALPRGARPARDGHGRAAARPLRRPASRRCGQLFDYNVDVTRTVVKMAHACGVSVEGEIGCLGSLENQENHSKLLTDPDEAVEFVKQTQIDALAVAIGTSHGAYKFSKPPTGEVLVISRLKTLQQRLPNTHFVMHGSSSVPQDWLKIINEYGGDIPQTYGVPVAEIVEGIKYGVRKVNIDTDLRMASTGAIRHFVANQKMHPSWMRAKFIKPQEMRCKRYVRRVMKPLAQRDTPSKIKAVPLSEMAKFY